MYSESGRQFQYDDNLKLSTAWEPWKKKFAIWPVRLSSGESIQGTYYHRIGTTVHTVTGRVHVVHQSVNIFDLLKQ